MTGSFFEDFVSAFGYGFRVDQLRAYRYGAGSSFQEVAGGFEIDSAGGDHFDLREGAAQRFDVFCSSDCSAGENLDGVGAGFPAPRIILSPNSSAIFSRARTAPGTVMVISAARMPPRWMAWMDLMAESAVEVRITGTTPISMMEARLGFIYLLRFYQRVGAVSWHMLIWREQFAGRL